MLGKTLTLSFATLFAVAACDQAPPAAPDQPLRASTGEDPIDPSQPYDGPVEAAPASTIDAAHVLVFNTFDSPFTPGVENQGWWSPQSFNSDINDNYVVGQLGSVQWNNFFTFDLSALSGFTANGATLEVRRGCSGGDPGFPGNNEATETYTMFDVSTPPAVLNFNQGTSAAIFNDLGSGVSYGSTTVPGNGGFEDLLSYPLNAAGVAAINAAAPGFFSIGGTLTSNDGDDFITGCTFNLGIQRLVVEIAIEVDIDIKPGSDPNSINCTIPQEMIPVAILTTADFDATTVDHTTVTFEGASEFHTTPQGVQRHEKDVDGDGDIDLVFHFRLGETGLDCSSIEGTLTGETFDGIPIEGTDAVNMIDPGKP